MLQLRLPPNLQLFVAYTPSLTRGNTVFSTCYETLFSINATATRIDK